MQELRRYRLVRVKLGIAALIAGAALMILAGDSSQAQSGNGSGMLVRTAAGADASQVTISGYAFSPAALTVKVGTTVTWVNKDDDPHSVDSGDGKFKSKALDTGSKFEFRFAEAGEYSYNCRFHPKMTGKIVVQP
ncbi:MAG TPA: cupredoxin family copper-binding protein [Terriglobales bacterium]|nr:cupredoxin family copper-binding protein [Terriglobales bacterium]